MCKAPRFPPQKETPPHDLSIQSHPSAEGAKNLPKCIVRVNSYIIVTFLAAEIWVDGMAFPFLSDANAKSMVIRFNRIFLK